MADWLSILEFNLVGECPVVRSEYAVNMPGVCRRILRDKPELPLAFSTILESLFNISQRGIT
jgi:hypothetical protein